MHVPVHRRTDRSQPDADDRTTQTTHGAAQVIAGRREARIWYCSTCPPQPAPGSQRPEKFSVSPARCHWPILNASYGSTSSAPFNVIRLAAAAIAATEPIDGERGVMIDAASVAAFGGQIGQPAYAASKGGVAAMTLPIARELASHLICVVTIAPGIFETPMSAGLPADAQKSLGTQVPHAATGQSHRIRRPGQPHRGQRLAQRRKHRPRRSHANGTPVRVSLEAPAMGSAA